jgi:Ni/Co efflux regulator RcnB
MRRMIITAVATVSLAAPSAAVAHAGGDHHRRHERHHHRHHARLLAFHAQAPASSTSGASGTGSPASSSDSAGTIASFAGGVLTIALNDGTTVSGKVTERTEIECPAPSASAADFSREDGGRDNGDDNGNDESGPSGEHGEPGAGDDDGNDDAGDEAGRCTTAALVPGASVEEALLSVSGEGASWLKVEL